MRDAKGHKVPVKALIFNVSFCFFDGKNNCRNYRDDGFHPPVSNLGVLIRETKGILSPYFLLLDQKKVTKKTQAFLTS